MCSSIAIYLYALSNCIVATEMECGGDLEATQELQYMATPYYGQGGWYENGDSCSWLITVNHCLLYYR